MSLQVREAALSDISYVVDLQRKNSDAIGFVPRAGYEWTVLGFNGQQNQRIWIADADGESVGFAYAGPGRNPGGVVTIHQACVQQDARRLEYGRALADAAEDFALQTQRHGVVIGVGTDLDSRSFWAALGYRLMSVEKRGGRRGRLVERRYKPVSGGLWMPAKEAA